MFKPQFAALVSAGHKLTTIRPVRKRPIKVGDILSLRKWSGMPYRSKQVWLRTSHCLRVQQIEFAGGAFFPWDFTVTVDGHELNVIQKITLAAADGFAGPNSMARWFKETHGLPFKGTLILWGDPNA